MKDTRVEAQGGILRQAATAAPPDALRSAFALFDVDGDGAISLAEFIRAR